MKKYFKHFFVMLFAFLLLPYTAHADMGPKATVDVEFLGLGDRTIYATLLSKESQWGPYAAYDGENSQYEEGEDQEIWKKFVSYKDSDGFYFLQVLSKQDINDNTMFWGYMPPETFKVLVYYPDTDTFVTSPVYSRYAFNSTYIAPLNEEKDGKFELQKNYSYKGEIIGFVARLIGTLAVELLIAYIFGYREKGSLKFIVGVNIFTQVILNLLLTYTLYSDGFISFMLMYVIGEGIVWLTEAVMYSIRLPKLSEKHKSVLIAILYATVANIASFLVGFYATLPFAS